MFELLFLNASEGEERVPKACLPLLRHALRQAGPTLKESEAHPSGARPNQTILLESGDLHDGYQLPHFENDYL
jgi:hypothetical protein